MKSKISLEDMNKLDELDRYLHKHSNYCLGYPESIDFDYTLLYKFLKYSINNAGDPYNCKGNYRMETLSLEREVVDFFAKILKAPANEYWGYITNGSTEGNLYGLYLAKKLYPMGIVYFSEDTHYSIEKNIDILGLRFKKIKSQENGEIDYNDLKKQILYHKEKPVIIVSNIGTTMKEGKDDIKQINQILHDLNIEDRYIHCDAAFCGCYAQFLSPKPNFDFSEGADSVIISGHKFIGSPIPCGIVVVLKANKDKVSRHIDYINDMDATITGSRNGFTTLIMWYAIKNLGIEGLRTRLTECLELADYTICRIKELGIKAWRNTNALTILIPFISNDFQQRWQLASQGEISHIIVRPGITKQVIDLFIKDLENEIKSL